MDSANIQLQQIAERNARDEIGSFIRIARVKSITGLSKSTILRWIKAKRFPAMVVQTKRKDGGIAVCLWDLAEVMQWRADQFAQRDERIAAEQQTEVSA